MLLLQPMVPQAVQRSPFRMQVQAQPAAASRGLSLSRHRTAGALWPPGLSRGNSTWLAIQSTFPKGGNSRCQTKVLSARSVPVLPSTRSSQRMAIAFLLVFHSRQILLNSLEQRAVCPFRLCTSLTKPSGCLLHSKALVALSSIRKMD